MIKVGSEKLAFWRESEFIYNSVIIVKHKNDKTHNGFEEIYFGVRWRVSRNRLIRLLTIGQSLCTRGIRPMLTANGKIDFFVKIPIVRRKISLLRNYRSHFFRNFRNTVSWQISRNSNLLLKLEIRPIQDLFEIFFQIKNFLRNSTFSALWLTKHQKKKKCKICIFLDTLQAWPISNHIRQLKISHLNKLELTLTT